MNIKLGKAVKTISGFTLMSRVVAVAREVLLSHHLGAGGAADAFVMAFRLPNLFRRFLGEGALNAAFIPCFSGIHENRGEKDANQMAERVFAILLWFLLAIVISAYFLMPWIVMVFAPGFIETPERYELAVSFSKITFPYILFISLAALFGAILNSLNKFAAPAATPVLLNIVLVTTMLVYEWFDISAGMALSIGVFIGGIVQCLFLYIVCWRSGVKLRIKIPKIDKDVKEVMKLIVPGLISASVFQINVFVDSWLASFLPQGSVSYLYYADRLNQLPLGVFGIAISTAMLPIMARNIQSKNFDEAKKSQLKAIELALKLTLPAMMALVFFSTPIIAMIYHHGKFGNFELMKTAPALSAYAIGLPGYVMCKVLNNSFFAKKDTKTPLKIAIVVVITNALLSYTLMQFFKHVGMAMATAITAWLNVFLLIIFLKKDDLFSATKEHFNNILKLIFCTIITGFAFFLLNKIYNHLMIDSHKLMKIFTTLSFVGIGAIVFVISGMMSGVIAFKRKI